jgi:hypothetical protein
MGASLNDAMKRLASPANGVESEAEIEATEPTEESEAVEQTAQAATVPTEELYTVKINGEERQVTLDELRSGYMMQADYSKKTAEVSEKRKQIEAKEAEINAKLDEAEELIKFELDEFQSEEMQELKDYDPESYWKKYDKVQSKAEKFKARKAEKQQKIAAQKAELLAKEQQKLIQKVPEWIDGDRMQSEAKELYQVMANLGYTQADIAELSDHRVFLLAREALKLQKINEQKPEDKLDKRAPKSAKPSGINPVDPADQKRKQIKSKLKKSGKLSDALELLSMR